MKLPNLLKPGNRTITSLVAYVVIKALQIYGVLPDGVEADDAVEKLGGFLDEAALVIAGIMAKLGQKRVEAKLDG